jgi:hypothetical protein
MSDFVFAPFTNQQVELLNQFQGSGKFHSFTCGSDNCRSILIATTNGWICPNCDYKQNWCHSFMVKTTNV